MALVTPPLDITLHNAPFEPVALLRDWEGLPEDEGHPAAESLFIGRVRATADNGTPLLALELEHYPGMTERLLNQLAQACCQRHGVSRCRVAHRIGRVLPGEAIVLVAVSADRRGPAQRCCGELLEALKHDAPFWKREWRADGSSHWITGNTPL